LELVATCDLTSVVLYHCRSKIVQGLSQRFDDVEICYQSTGWCVSHLTLDVFSTLPVLSGNLHRTITVDGTWMLYE